MFPRHGNSGHNVSALRSGGSSSSSPLLRHFIDDSHYNWYYVSVTPGLCLDSSQVEYEAVDWERKLCGLLVTETSRKHE